MGTPYETDIAAWAVEQAALLRSGNLSGLDALNIAEEIDDVGKNEHRALASHLIVLLAHLLKWKFQPQRRSQSWLRSVKAQRNEVLEALHDSPSLKRDFDNEQRLGRVWDHAVGLAHAETGLEFPETWLWTLDQVLDPGFMPD